MSVRLVFIVVVAFLVSAGLAFMWFRNDRSSRGIGEQSGLLSQVIPVAMQPVATFTPTPIPALVLPPLPVSKTLPGGTHTFQTFNNCGPSSLSMALSYYGYDVTQQTLGQELRPYQNPVGNNDDKSVTLLELAKKAEEYDLVAYHRPAGDIELLQQFVAHDMPVITRTWLKQGEDIGHFRVVKGYDQANQILIQDDSLQGKGLSYSYEAFLELWKAFNYEFLVLVPKDKVPVAEAILGDRLEVQDAWGKALTIAEAEAVAQPNNHFAEFNRSVALYHLGRYQESVASFERAEPDLPSRMLWYQVEPLLAYYRAGELQTVLERSNAILANQNRAYSELYYLQGLAYQQQAMQGLVSETQATEAFTRADQYNTAQYWRYNVE